MPKTKISEYSVTNSSNTDIEGINIDEGCAPSGINNAIRELMVHLKEFQTGASGDAFTFAGGVLISGTANTITGNVLMSGTNTITGSTTATFAAGAVGTPSIAAHGDTNTGIFFPAADTIAFAEGGAEAMRIDSSGNVGIGTSSPAFNDGSGIAVYNATAARIKLGDSTSGIGANDGLELIYDNDAYVYNRENTALIFGTNNTERMRIDSSGNLLVGTTSAGADNAISLRPDATSKFYSGGTPTLDLGRGVSDGSVVTFQRSGNAVGSISVTLSATAYNTSSDYRLKENVAPMAGALAKVQALNPVTYTWKVDGSAGEGFIAHELAEVVPDCVTGEKDAVDADGNPVYQGVDTSFLVATLTAAIQELKAITDAQATRIEALEAEVAAMKAGNGN